MAGSINQQWKISVDTGGTFSDVIGVDPSGQTHRLKILSDASTRETVADAPSSTSLRLERALPDGLFDGASLLSSSGAKNSILRQRGQLLELADSIDLRAGARIELHSPLQVPTLAAHWITRTPVQDALPTMQLRLASTRATNALLERQGARCAMLLTRGLEDLLAIGTQQRPELFARVVRKSPPFAERSIGCDERLDAQGDVLIPLDEVALRTQLLQLREEGFDSIGISLLHAYRNNAHELRAATIARECGFSSVSCSSELSVRQGYLERTRGCEINSYLKPVLRDYLGEIRGKLNADSSLLIMSSAAELLSPARFQPKDSLLSGPAGGVLGAARAAKVLDIAQALSFDMGGTSTDVARMEGDPELTHRHRVGDAELWAAAVDVESVAAGGGSICWIEDGLPQVGPQSAGARPGPACYGAGGPLAITDVNLLLGRLRPERFPFELDVEASRIALRACLTQLNDPTLSEEMLLEGFLRVANETMAEAIRRVTLRRGRDPREHHLIAFGGAGGQHACAIASLLELAAVVIPPEPSLLSAIGVASATRAHTAERQILLPLSKCTESLSGWIDELEQHAVAELQRDGSENSAVRKREAELRYRGQESVVTVEFNSSDDLQTRFLKRYEQIHLHRPTDRAIELVTLRVTAAERPSESKVGDFESDAKAPPTASNRVYHDAAWHVATVVQRDGLSVGHHIDGPALIEEEHSVFFLPPGWQATMHTGGSIVAKRLNSAVVKTTCGSDVIERQLFMHRFEAIAKEMGERLRHAAVSTNVKEREDFSCAVLDKEGRLVVNAPHIPVHLGALGSCVRAVRRSMELLPGDFIITNHPAYGGSHLPDITVLAPVHDESGRLLAHVACRAHHAEIGGISPGSMPAHAKRLVEEGVVLKPLRLAKNGVFDLESLRRALQDAPYPSRAVDDNLADTQAMLVACRRGVEALRELGAAMTEPMHALRELAARRCRHALRRWGNGSFLATETLDDGSPLRVAIELDDGTAVIDFRGSAPTHPGNLNATEAVVTSCVLYVLRLMAGADLPFNEGLLDPVKIIIPPGLLSPDFSGPAQTSPAIVGGNVETSQRIVDLLLSALGWSACSQGTMNNLSFGNEQFSYYETLGGGVGAGPDYHGESAVHSHMTNTRITDVEVLEHRHPVRVWRFLIRPNSGGRGANSGGDGITRELEFTEPVRLSLLTQHRKFGPGGARGGADGAPGRQWLLRQDGSRLPLESIAEEELAAGERVIIETPGGGGWGRP